MFELNYESGVVVSMCLDLVQFDLGIVDAVQVEVKCLPDQESESSWQPWRRFERLRLASYHIHPWCRSFEALS